MKNVNIGTMLSKFGLFENELIKWSIISFQVLTYSIRVVRQFTKGILSTWWRGNVRIVYHSETLFKKISRQIASSNIILLGCKNIDHSA